MKKDILTQNAGMLELLSISTKVAWSMATVLIQGETGTGKELLARYIHDRSSRSDSPYIAVNCAAIPGELLESELFGNEKGSFTGAHFQKRGKFEAADKGTILLDEIGDMPIQLQAKMLRFLQEGEIDRVGGIYPIPVDVRIIATTNVDLSTAVDNGSFRRDLFYRLNVINLEMPPLRDRRDDIPYLARLFAIRHAKAAGRTKSISDDVLTYLCEYDWPGNIRELENIMYRAVILSHDEPVIRKQHLMVKTSMNEPSQLPIMTIPELEDQLFMQAFKSTGGNKMEMADQLGVNVKTVRNKMRYQPDLFQNVLGIEYILPNDPLETVKNRMIRQVMRKTGGNKTATAKRLGISIRNLRNKTNREKERVEA